jgi:hypothetical protein
VSLVDGSLEAAPDREARRRMLVALVGTLRVGAVSGRTAKESFLQSVKIFGSLSWRKISRVVDVIEEVVLGPNELVIKEGDQADSMYIIEEGECSVSQKGKSAADGETLLRVLKPGDYFGDRALLFDERRSATVTAISRIKLMRLDKESFRVLLSDLHAELLLRVPRDERWKKTEPRPTEPPHGSRRGEVLVTALAAKFTDAYM